jgi:hypothetical protein
MPPQQLAATGLGHSLLIKGSAEPWQVLNFPLNLPTPVSVSHENQAIRPVKSALKLLARDKRC